MRLWPYPVSGRGSEDEAGRNLDNECAWASGVIPGGILEADGSWQWRMSLGAGLHYRYQSGVYISAAAGPCSSPFYHHHHAVLADLYCQTHPQKVLRVCGTYKVRGHSDQPFNWGDSLTHSHLYHTHITSNNLITMHECNILRMIWVKMVPAQVGFNKLSSYILCIYFPIGCHMSAKLSYHVCNALSKWYQQVVVIIDGPPTLHSTKWILNYDFYWRHSMSW